MGEFQSQNQKFGDAFDTHGIRTIVFDSFKQRRRSKVKIGTNSNPISRQILQNNFWLWFLGFAGGAVNEDEDTTIRDVTREDGTVTVVLPSSRPHSTEPEKQTAQAQEPVAPPQAQGQKPDQPDDGMLCYKSGIA